MYTISILNLLTQNAAPKNDIKSFISLLIKRTTAKRNSIKSCCKRKTPDV